MIKNKDEFESELQQLQCEMNKGVHSNIDAKNKILNLADEMVSSFSAQHSLTLWKKEHIIRAVNSLNWCWFRLACQCLSKALCDENKISPTVTYSEEVTQISADKIIKHINSLKKSINLND